MRILSWLRDLSPSSAPRRTPARKRKSARLGVEPLEDRTVPSGLGFSTYLGGASNDWGYAVAVDARGDTFVTGLANSNDFPTTKNAVQPRLAGGGLGNGNAFVTEFDPTGALVYSSYLGGPGSAGTGIAVDGAGFVYVTGRTTSSKFPTTANAFQRTLGGGTDAFVAKLSIGTTSSALVYATYLGGSADENLTDSGVNDPVGGIAVDGSGNVYVTGNTTSTNFPVSAGAYEATYGGNRDAFVTKLNTNLSGAASRVYSTYLGGGGKDRGYGIAVDGSGSAYVTGYTASATFPTTPGALQTALAGTQNAFVTKLGATGAAVYSTYLSAGGYDSGTGIAVDDSGDAYVAGTTSAGATPDAFVTKLDPTGSALAYSTAFGGDGTDVARGIAVDASGNVYVTGWTTSANLPAATGAYGGGVDAFVTKLDASGAVVSSTYLGGSGEDRAYGVALDGSGNVHLAGYTTSADFPTKNPYQATLGYEDAFVATITF